MFREGYKYFERNLSDYYERCLYQRIYQALKNYQPYLVSAIRLIFVPVVILLLCRVFSLSPMLTTACMISAAVPSANNTVMFAAKYSKDTGAASKTIAINSFLSVITLPVMIALSKL